MEQSSCFYTGIIRCLQDSTCHVLQLCYTENVGCYKLERSSFVETYTEELITAYGDFEEERTCYKDSTYDIVSKVAYLIGVPLRIFEHQYEPPKIEIYRVLDRDKNARIIRHLCIIRTAIERGFGHISALMRQEHRSLLSMPEYLPQESIHQLNLDGICFVKKTSTKLNQHIMEINRILSDRINNCKSYFPVWLDWNYIRDLFLMPKGLTEEGTKEAARTYFENLEYYPYKIYINWVPQPNGNILYNDKKFVTLLYQWHNDYFADYSKVSDAGSFVKSNIYDFIDGADRAVMVVDCENSDPYRLCATLNGLDADSTSKIQKIMLFDDVHTVDAWRILESHTKLPVEHVMTERVKQSKSLVDIEMTARTCMEHYRNQVDSFIIVSSDSDYWGLITSLPDARFLMMIEREKCGPDMKTALANSGIFYCYIDDFYEGNSENIKKTALFNAIYRSLDSCLHFNAIEMFESALASTRIDMPLTEKRQFFDKYIRKMQLIMDKSGNVSVQLNVK